MDYGFVFIVLACVVGLWMTWGIGANDLANIMSTTMGSKAVSLKQAMVSAIVFEIAGAFCDQPEIPVYDERFLHRALGIYRKLILLRLATRQRKI